MPVYSTRDRCIGAPVSLPISPLFRVCAEIVERNCAGSMESLTLYFYERGNLLFVPLEKTSIAAIMVQVSAQCSRYFYFTIPQNYLHCIIE